MIGQSSKHSDMIGYSNPQGGVQLCVALLQKGFCYQMQLLHPVDAQRFVALQVEFERQILKPAFHLIGYRLWV
jgi:hypothetical protein